MSRKAKTKPTLNEDDAGPSLFDDAEEKVKPAPKKQRAKRRKIEEEEDENELAQVAEEVVAAEVPKLEPEQDMDAEEEVPPVQILPPPKGYDFVIAIPNSASLKTLVDICSHVLEDIVFTVVSSVTFSGLCLNCADASNCCMIIGRYACDTKSRPNQHFCVKMSVLTHLLKLVTPRHCVQISRKSDSSVLEVLIKDPHDSSQYLQFDINTLDRDAEQTMLDSFSSNYTIEIELNEFRGLAKMAKDLKADELVFQIFEPKVPGPLRSSYLVLSINGDQGGAKCKKVFHSLTEWQPQNEDGDGESGGTQIVIKTAEQTVGEHRTMPPENELNTCLNEMFSIDYLIKFMTSMKRPVLKVHLSSEGQPMVLRHPLGSESQLSFVLAPKLKEEENPVGAADVDEDQ